MSTIINSYGDVECKGVVVRRYDYSVVFRDSETGKEVRLPREEIAIVQDVDGDIVTLPKKLALAKGLIKESGFFRR